jgi:enediyne biosynthesis thioesterase
MNTYEYRHVIGFEETNLVGNVYYVNLLRWQGRCREMFLRQYAPGVVRDLAGGLCLVTTHCSCDYLAELTAFEEVVVRMQLRELTQNRIGMAFEYWRCSAAGEELVARGEQKVACMRRGPGGTTTPAAIPPDLRRGLEQFLHTHPDAVVRAAEN